MPCHEMRACKIVGGTQCALQNGKLTHLPNWLYRAISFSFDTAVQEGHLQSSLGSAHAPPKAPHTRHQRHRHCRKITFIVVLGHSRLVQVTGAKQIRASQKRAWDVGGSPTKVGLVAPWIGGCNGVLGNEIVVRAEAGPVLGLLYTNRRDQFAQFQTYAHEPQFNAVGGLNQI
jgi:hypothetical protein